MVRNGRTRFPPHPPPRQTPRRQERATNHERLSGVVDWDDPPRRGACGRYPGHASRGVDAISTSRARSRSAVGEPEPDRTRAGDDRIRRTRRRPCTTCRSRRLHAPGRPAARRGTGRDGVCARRPAAVRCHDRRARALGPGGPRRAARHAAYQTESVAARRRAAAGFRLGRGIGRPAGQPGPAEQRDHRAAGLRCHRHQHHAGRRREQLRADRPDRPLHRVLRRSDRSGAADPPPGRHQPGRRHGPDRHRRGGRAHPAARPGAPGEGTTVGRDCRGVARRPAGLPLRYPGDPQRARRPDPRPVCRRHLRVGRVAAAQQDRRRQSCGSGHGRRRRKHPTDHPAALRAFPGARYHDPAAGTQHRRRGGAHRLAWSRRCADRAGWRGRRADQHGRNSVGRRGRRTGRGGIGRRRCGLGHVPCAGLVRGAGWRQRAGARPQLDFLPPEEPVPVEEPLPWYRRPQLIFAAAAVLLLAAVGGLAYTLTGNSSSSGGTSTATSRAVTNPESPGVPLTQTVTVTGSNGSPTVVAPPTSPPAPGPTPTSEQPSTTTETTTTTEPTTTTYTTTTTQPTTTTPPVTTTSAAPPTTSAAPPTSSAPPTSRRPIITLFPHG